MYTFNEIVIAIIFLGGFYIGWKFSNLFLSIQDLFCNSFFGILLIKLGIAGGFGIGLSVGAIWLWAAAVSSF